MKRWPRGAATLDARDLPLTSLYTDSPDAHPAAWTELLARWQSLERALPELIETALGRLLARELALRPEHIRATVAELLDRLQPGGDTLELRVHPDDASLLRGLPLTSVTVVPDGSITPGGCILAQAGVELDARLETRLARVLSALR